MMKNARNCQRKVKKILGNDNVRRKMLGIVNARCKNARNPQCVVRKCSEIINMGGKNTRDRQCMQKNARNRQCVRKIYSGSSMCTEKMLGIVNVKWENARNRQ